MNWGSKEPGCLAGSGKCHWVVCISNAILRVAPRSIRRWRANRLLPTPSAD